MFQTKMNHKPCEMIIFGVCEICSYFCSQIKLLIYGILEKGT